MTDDPRQEPAPAPAGEVRPADPAEPPYPQAPVVTKVEAVVALLVNLNRRTEFA